MTNPILHHVTCHVREYFVDENPSPGLQQLRICGEGRLLSPSFLEEEEEEKEKEGENSPTAAANPTASPASTEDDWWTSPVLARGGGHD